MFTFAYPGLLFLFLIIPALVLLYFSFRLIRKKRIKKFGDPSFLNILMPEVSKYKPTLRFIICIFALIAIIFALARPWGGIKSEETTREGIEIVIAVDASNSMLASSTSDEKGPDRMRTAKIMLETLINRLGNDRIGLIAFAGNAYTLIPVTNDYVTAKAFLNSIDPSLIQNQGTDISSAIALAEKSFSDNRDIGKAIILLTDAEELESNDQVLEQVQQAAKRGIQTDVIGIGSSPVTIPSKTNGRMIDSETGQIVKTGLNEELAIDIAKAGKGIYVNASNNDSVDELVKQLGKLKKSAMESSFLVSHEELYYPFVIFAIVLLIIDAFMSDKKNKWLDKINFFKNSTVIIILFIGLNAVSCTDKNEKMSEESPKKVINQDSLMMVTSTPEEFELIMRGNDSFARGDLEGADSIYNSALAANPRSLVANLNLGVNRLNMVATLQQQAQSQNGQMPDSIVRPLVEAAVSNLQVAAGPKIEKGNVSSSAFYNIGNVDFIQENYAKAIEDYKEALRLNPKDNNARKNLRIAQLQKKDNQNQQNKPQQDQQDQQQQNQQDQQQNQQQQQKRDQLNEQTIQQILQAAENAENEARIKFNIKKGENRDQRNPNRKNW